MIHVEKNIRDSFQFVFCCCCCWGQSTSCIRKPHVISEGGGLEGVHLLHPPPQIRPCQDASIRPFRSFVDRRDGFLFLFVYSFKD